MSHVYQPVMIRTVLEGGGAATRRQIAAAFLAADLSQLGHYEEIAKRYPTETLVRRHGILEHSKGVYRLAGDVDDLNEWERAALIALCDSRVADYIAARQDAVWQHRSQNFDPIPGSLRFRVLARAMTRCEACGVTNVERALHVDHIVPRSRGGSNDLTNLQALCDACNAQKKNKDQTDFHAAHASYADRDPGCPFCDPSADRVELSNELALVIPDRYPVTPGHRLIVPRRHTAEYLDLRQPEINALQALLRDVTAALRSEDPSVAGFNIEANNGVVAGQTIFHCHLHIIPRRDGDVEDPRGGVRGVIPGRQAY